MNKDLDLIKRQQPEIIDGFPTGNIFIGVTEEELAELKKELKDKEKFDNFMKRYNLKSIEELDDFFNQRLNKEIEKCSKCKELKALEIIKENRIEGLTLEWDGTWWIVCVPNYPFPIAYGRKKEDYDLLKEVLL